MKLEQRYYADCVDELRQQAAEWADQGCIYTADILRRAAFELEKLRRECAAISPLYEALRVARVALLNGTRTNEPLRAVEKAMALAEEVTR